MRTRLPDWARVVLIVVGLPLALTGVNGLIWATVALDGNPPWATHALLLLGGLGAVILGVWPSSRRGAAVPSAGRVVLVVGGLLVALFGVLMIVWSDGSTVAGGVAANPYGGYAVFSTGPSGYAVGGEVFREPTEADEPVVTGTREEVYDWVYGRHDWETRTAYVVLTAGLVALAAGAWPQRQQAVAETPPTAATSSTLGH